MSCCSNKYKSSAYRSVQTAYNNSEQAFVATGTQINVLGSLVCDTGCSVETDTGGFSILSSGLYRISYDVVATPSATGTMVLQLYNGTTALPCAVANVTSDASTTESMHVETVIRLTSCCGVRPIINAQISGVAGSVAHVCANVVRIA